ncbi:MAG: response regulator transcription factor [Lewinellaceae bacterium]|nr:response regulator transcription factor [Saprospiraceae bacterium]MCB9337294.1 response regulator transcription factor [Lewinellaceae bacterium]
MSLLRCLIVEDEPLAAEGLEEYIRQTPLLELAGTCPDALAALDFLKKHPVDVLFLDIHLPKLKGLDFLKTLQHRPQVILTTAYHQYALEGYELDVVDYLLKPFGFPRFLAAVNKLKTTAQPGSLQSAAPISPNRPFRFFNENKRQVKVYYDEILYVESLKEYVKIYLAGGKKVVTKFQIGEFEDLLKAGNLLRIHRSFLVAKDKIEAFSAHEIEVGGEKLPVGRSYKMQVEEELKNF